MKPFFLSWIFFLKILFFKFLKGNIKSKTYLTSVDYMEIKFGWLDTGITSFEILFFIFWCHIFWQKAFNNGKCKPFLFCVFPCFTMLPYPSLFVTFEDLNWEFLFGCVVVENGENRNETLINFLLQNLFHSFHYLMCMVELQDVLIIFGDKRQTFWDQQTHYNPIICRCNL
jgi:hypothetical protein